MNLYAQTKGQQAIRELTRAMVDSTGNLPPVPGTFPDYPAPIVRNTAEGRELTLARWGMPTPAKYRVGRKTDSGVTNIRNPKHLAEVVRSGIPMRRAVDQFLGKRAFA